MSEYEVFYMLVDEVYKHNGAGGLLHIILDDGNIDNEYIEFCRKCVNANVRANYTPIIPIYYIILDILASKNVRERDKLLRGEYRQKRS